MTKEEALKVIRDMAYLSAHVVENGVEAYEYIEQLLSNPSLPSNLDEAARMYRNYREECGIKDPVMLNEIEEAHYAGAELMAEQGETHEHYVIREVAGHDVGPAIVSYPETFELGDKVIVQIRKK